MRARKPLPKFVILISMLVMTACLLPGMIPLDREQEQETQGAMPVMEADTDTVLQILQSGEWIYLQALAEEEYTDEDYARPGTLTYTVSVTDDLPVYFVYGWCTVDEEILRQNFEHIRISLSINGEPLDEEVIHNLSYTSPSSLVCLDFGALITDWPAGEYRLEAVVTFDEQINDGLADFAAGDYVFVYNVTVAEPADGTEAPPSG